MWYSLLLLGYKPVEHVTVLNTVDNCNTVVSIIILYFLTNYNIMDHRLIYGPSLTETSLCDAYLYSCLSPSSFSSSSYYFHYISYHLYAGYSQIHLQQTVCRIHSAAAVLYLHFALHVMLSHMLNMFCTFMSILPKYVRSAQYGRFL